jgi:NAD-dependent DNA ligase
MGVVRNVADIFSLQATDFELKNSTTINAPDNPPKKSERVAGWGDKSINKLLNEIHAKKTVSFARSVIICDVWYDSNSSMLNRFLYALGIPNIGEHSAQLIASRFESFDELWLYLNGQLKGKHARFRNAVTDQRSL